MRAAFRRGCFSCLSAHCSKEWLLLTVWVEPDPVIIPQPCSKPARSLFSWPGLPNRRSIIAVLHLKGLHNLLQSGLHLVPAPLIRSSGQGVEFACTPVKVGMP